MINKHFNKELVVTKEDDEGFVNSIKYCICDNVYDDSDVKVRDHCHITGKDRHSVHRDYNISVIFNYKIPVKFHNLKNYGSLLIMQDLGKFNFIKL